VATLIWMVVAFDSAAAVGLIPLALAVFAAWQLTVALRLRRAVKPVEPPDAAAQGEPRASLGADVLALLAIGAAGLVVLVLRLVT
jgi:hypothetical protein